MCLLDYFHVFGNVCCRFFYSSSEFMVWLARRYDRFISEMPTPGKPAEFSKLRFQRPRSIPSLHSSFSLFLAQVRNKLFLLFGVTHSGQVKTVSFPLVLHDDEVTIKLWQVPSQWGYRLNLLKSETRIVKLSKCQLTLADEKNAFIPKHRPSSSYSANFHRGGGPSEHLYDKYKN